jgi:hypothetical protein
MDDFRQSRIGRSILPASLVVILALLALQGCSDMSRGGGTTNKILLMNMGISDTSYSSRQAGGHG